jgi:PAS domain S-box-containing protein
MGLFLLTGYLTYQDQRTMLLKVALEHARGIATQVIETRNYMADVVKDEPETNYALIPEAVATGIAQRLTAGSPYYVRQISIRYRNPSNRPDAYETAQLERLSEAPAHEIYEMTKVERKPVFRYMRGMVAENSCLRCHGSYEDAPKFVQQRFPAGHPSYGYQSGEMIGAISVSIPLVDLFGGASTNLIHELLSRLGILLLIFIAIGLLIQRFITNPVSAASTTMSRVAKTGNLTERVSIKTSNDEIGKLISGFNEMMETLERTNLQRQESEDRYGNLIEAADTGIVTFLADGKIIISNRLAEKLFSLAKKDLLGMTIFDLLVNGKDLQQKIANLSSAEASASAREVILDQILSKNGHKVNVEMTLILASSTGHVPMYSVLLKENT